MIIANADCERKCIIFNKFFGEILALAHGCDKDNAFNVISAGSVYTKEDASHLFGCNLLNLFNQLEPL
jgi:hypothetical protein